MLPSLVLVWPSNCGLASLTETIAARPSRMSSPVRLSSALEQLLVARVLVDDRGQRGPEAFLVGAALVRVDRVGEGVDRLAVRLVPLHRDLDRHAVRFLAELDHRSCGSGSCVGVEVPDEVGDAALVAWYRARLGVSAWRSSARVMVRPRFRKAISCIRREIVSNDELGRLEDRVVRPERDGGAGFVGLAAPLDQRADRLAALVALGPDVAVPVDLDLEPASTGRSPRRRRRRAGRRRPRRTCRRTCRRRAAWSARPRPPAASRPGARRPGCRGRCRRTRTPPSASSVTSMVSQ